MVYSGLAELISHLEYGTRLHIGVLFFGRFKHEALTLPDRSTIHASPVCDEMKGRPNGFARCYRCRNTAIRHALNTKCAFGGLCIHGVYEYTRPILIGGEVAALLFIGNILPQNCAKIKHRLGGNAALLDTMESDFSAERCARLGDLIESYIRMLLELTDGEGAEGDPLIADLKGYIESNLEYRIELPLLARMFHYNEKYLGRLFKRRVGQSFSDYINTRRIERAKELLVGEKSPVTAIAARVGFNSVSYFNRVFRAQAGLAPVAYRKRYAKK